MAIPEGHIMRDSAYLIEKIFQEAENLIVLSYHSEEKMQLSCFDKLLNEYEGFDLVEVICREAAYITIKDNLKSIFRHEASISRRYYLSILIMTAQKYSTSENWPMVETQRAKAFDEYVQSISSKLQGF